MKYDESASTVTCTFIDQPGSAVSVRSCQIQYGDCSSELTKMSHGNATAKEVVLNLRLTESGQEYCYLITASNGLDTVMVEGRISKCICAYRPILLVWEGLLSVYKLLICSVTNICSGFYLLAPASEDPAYKTMMTGCDL